MSNAALERPRSALPDVPSRQDLEALSPADLWTLEERVSEIQDSCRELNNERLRHWVEVEGKTQAEIAKLIGRTQARVSQRCRALGIAPAGTGRPRDISAYKEADSEVIDAEVVEDDPQPRPPSQRPVTGPAHAPTAEPGPAPSDPGPRVKCPTCGHMVKPDDIGVWQ